MKIGDLFFNLLPAELKKDFQWMIRFHLLDQTLIFPLPLNPADQEAILSLPQQVVGLSVRSPLTICDRNIYTAQSVQKKIKNIHPGYYLLPSPCLWLGGDGGC
jgi:hypothetical protein